MVYDPHLKVKPQVLIQAAVSALSDQLVISNDKTHNLFSDYSATLDWP